MWTITVFEKKTFRFFQYEDKNEATVALKGFTNSAILTYTNPF